MTAARTAKTGRKLAQAWFRRGQFQRQHKLRWHLTAGLGALWLTAAASGPAGAVSIELKDVAPDRIERQRAAAEGTLPLPSTPDVARLTERLAEKGLKRGSPILLRAFKSESEFEVWIRKDDAYVLFATYPVCQWSGTLGPKLREGDRQTPEGFYTVTRAQMHHVGRWPRSLNLGFPNVFDKAQARNGSHILVHGGCSSVGCFAMTNAVIEEIYDLTDQALAGGQTFVPVHVFPFRMTQANLESQKDSPWHGFWTNLKVGYDAVERTHRPPRVAVCENSYRFQDLAPEEGGDPGPLAACGETLAALEALEQLSPTALAQLSQQRNQPVPGPRSLPADSRLYPNWAGPSALSGAGWRASTGQESQNRNSALSHGPLPGRAARSPPPCSTQRASCRRYVALHDSADQKRLAAQARRRERHAARR